MNSETLCFFDLNSISIFDIFDYFLFLKSWFWHSINIGNELCNTLQKLFKATFTLLLSRQTKTPAATENSRFIIKPAVQEFIISLLEFKLQVLMRPVRRHQNTFFLTLIKKKLSKKQTNIIHTPI